MEKNSRREWRVEDEVYNISIGATDEMQGSLGVREGE